MVEGFKREIGYREHCISTLDVCGSEELCLEQFESLLEAMAQPNPKTMEELSLSREAVIGRHGIDERRGSAHHGGGPAGTNVMRVGFKLDASASGALDGFLQKGADHGEDGGLRTLALAVSSDETIVVRSKSESFKSPEAAAAHLKSIEDLPAVFVCSAKGEQDAVSLVLHCPDDAHVRSKMLHSAALSALPSLIESHGLTVAGTSTIQSPDEILPSLLAPASPSAAADEDDAGAPIVDVAPKAPPSRPKRAGRAGSSRLIK